MMKQLASCISQPKESFPTYIYEKYTQTHSHWGNPDGDTKPVDMLS